MTIFGSFSVDESGATAIEYGLLVGLIAVAAITAVDGMTTSLYNLFDGIAYTLTTTSDSGPG